MKALIEKSKISHTTYVWGFVISLILTLEAYFLVQNEMLSRSWLIVTVVVLALIQLLTQLVFFLHLGRESRPYWNLITMATMLVVLVILVFGSLWIMYSLNYHMSDHKSDQDIIQDEGFHSH